MDSVKIKKTDGLVVPKQAKKGDAGYDIVASSDPEIMGKSSDGIHYESIDYIQYKTGLYISPPVLGIVIKPTQDTVFSGVHTLIHPRSSISKYNLMLKNSIALIDASYTGELLLRFAYIIQPEDLLQQGMVEPGKSNPYYKTVCRINLDKIYKKGDRIAQLVFQPTMSPSFSIVDELPETERGSGGFGSTDNIPPHPSPSLKERYEQITHDVYKAYSELIKQREKQREDLRGLI
jgi:dUTP pyrophosphatase